MCRGSESSVLCTILFYSTQSTSFEKTWSDLVSTLRTRQKNNPAEIPNLTKRKLIIIPPQIETSRGNEGIDMIHGTEKPNDNSLKNSAPGR